MSACMCRTWMHCGKSVLNRYIFILILAMMANRALLPRLRTSFVGPAWPVTLSFGALRVTRVDACKRDAESRKVCCSLCRYLVAGGAPFHGSHYRSSLHREWQ